MARFAVWALGPDQTGIVEEISDVLLLVDGNIESSLMGRLGAHFSMSLAVLVPDECSIEALRDDLEIAGRRLGLDGVLVVPIADVDGRPTAASHEIHVRGPDHPGIVHNVSRVLASRCVSIVHGGTATGSSAALTGSDEHCMVLDVSVPTTLSELELDVALDPVRQAEDVQIGVRRITDPR